MFKYMRKTHFLLIAIFLTTLSIHSQETPTEVGEANTNNAEVIDKKPLSIRKNAITVSLGDYGVGLGYARKLSPKFNAIIAYNIAKINDTEVDVSSFLGNDDVSFSGGTASTIIDLGAEYVPFTNSSFKLIFGVGYLNDVSVNGTISYKEGITVGDVNIAPEDVGKVDVTSNWTGVAPFIGIGFGRAVPKNRFGFGIDVGTYYANAPTVYLLADKLLAPTQNEQSTLQVAFESLRFIPRIQFRVTYKF